MKRHRIKNRLRFTAFMAFTALFCVIIFGSLTGSCDAAGMNEPEYKVIYVEEGDTLWDIAKSYGPANEDIRDVIHEIGRINGVSPSNLRPGMEISVPAKL